MQDAPEFIYKITTHEQWEVACAKGVFEGAPIDLQDGYIHFSTSSQMEETANKHFTGQGNLKLVQVPTSSLGDALKWEVSRGGELFPHLYATLETNKASAVHELRANQDGIYTFPEGLA